MLPPRFRPSGAIMSETNLVGLGIGLDLGDGDTSVLVGVNADDLILSARRLNASKETTHLGVGKTGVFVRVDVEQVSLG